MTPEQEAELVDKMAKEACESMGTPWDALAPEAREERTHEMRAALSIAKPIIRDEALEEANKTLFALGLDNVPLFMQHDICARDMQISAAIRALKSKGQKP